MGTKTLKRLTLVLLLVLMGCRTTPTPEPTLDLDIGSRASSPTERICIDCGENSTIHTGGDLRLYSDRRSTETLRLDGTDGTLYLYLSGSEVVRVDPVDGVWLTGDGTLWEDLRVPLETGKTAGSNVPTFEQIVDDGSGSAGVFAYNFDDGDEIWLSVQMPHAWKIGSTIYPHLHWAAEGDASTKNVGLGIEYTWTNIGADISATTIVTRDVAGGTALSQQIHDVPSTGWDGTGKTLSSIILCRIFRQAAAADNYTGGVFLLEFDVHYELDSLGSRQVTTK